MSNKIVKKDQHGTPEFILEFLHTPEFLHLTSVTAHIAVSKVVGWGPEGGPAETEPYLSGTMTWEGCSNIVLGDPNDVPGGLHLCGVDEWKRHCALMEWVYRETSQRISLFADDEYWTP